MTPSVKWMLLAALIASGAADCPAQAPVPSIKTVFIILEENQNWPAVTPALAPYIRNTLLPMGAHAEEYYNPPGLHPSEPNYIWLEAGNNLGITNDLDPMFNHQSTTEHLVTYLNKASISWKAYAEDIDGKVCPLTNVNQYAPRHNPFIFFDDVTNGSNPSSADCIAHIRPYSELASDLQNNTMASYNFIIPNLCNDMHDCGVTAGDAWLAKEVPQILASKAYKDGGALFITWDEADIGDGPIGMVVLSPFAKVNYSNTVRYTHSSTLRTLEEIFGVTPFLGDAASSTDLSDLFVPGSFGPPRVNEGGIVNNASYRLASTAVAPGAITSIWGSNLTDGTTCVPPTCNPSFDTTGALIPTLAGARVSFNGVAAPILAAPSSSQLVAQVPVELAGASSATVRVTVNGQTSAASAVLLAPITPGLISVDASGSGQGAILNDREANLGAASLAAPVGSAPNAHPAARGDVIEIFGTGLGAMIPPVPTGMRPWAATQTATTPAVTIGGVSATVLFSGLAGCCVGLNQVNVAVPGGAPTGNSIPVVLSIGGMQSNSVTIAVQ